MRRILSVALGLVAISTWCSAASDPVVPAVSSTSTVKTPPSVVRSTASTPKTSAAIPAADEFDLNGSSLSVNAPAFGGLPVPPQFSTSTFQQDVSSDTANAAAEEKHISKFAKIVRLHAEGQQNVRERVILAEVKARKGDVYDPDRLRKDVQSIYALGNFDDVTLDVNEVPGGVSVIFRVVEKPMIKKIDFKGNKTLKKGKLSDTIALKEGDPLDKLKMNLDVDKILTLYKDEGFAAAEVEPFTTSDPTNHVTVTFFVKEGTQVIIDDVNIQGVTAFKLKKIAKLMKMRRKKVFKQDQLSKDVDEILKFYRHNGYQNIKVDEIKQNFNADKTRVTLVVPIQEGPLFHFGTVTFSGNAIFANEKLLPAIQFKAGETFDQEKMDATQSKLQDIYGAQGYIRVQIKPDFHQNPDKGIVDTTFNISEGEVVYVDHIGIEGNTHTKDFVIRREIKLKEGDPFSSVLARKSVERLYNLGFLDNVDVDVQQPNSPNKADIVFTVTEGKPGMLSAGAGYSSVDGLIGTFQVQHTNFLGRGQRLNLMLQFGGRLQSYDIGWTEPWFMGKPVTFGVDVFRVTRILQLGSITDAYTSRNTGASITAGPRFSDVYSLLFTYSAAQNYRYDVNDDSATRAAVLGTNAATDAGIVDAKFFTSNLTEQFIRDTRDNQFDPQRGMKTSLSLTEGGLAPSAIQFYKTIVDHSIHIPTWWKLVLSIHGQWGYVQTYGGSTTEDIVDELFRVGGSDTVRGYALGQVGASSINGDPGGRVSNVYNVEYKFPIAPDEHGKTLLQGVLFYDIGGDWDRLGGVNYKVNNSPYGLRQGVGFGIRFKTPVFPLRLDWGVPLNPAPGDAHSQFYFNVGSLF